MVDDSDILAVEGAWLCIETLKSSRRHQEAAEAHCIIVSICQVMAMGETGHCFHSCVSSLYQPSLN